MSISTILQIHISALTKYISTITLVLQIFPNINTTALNKEQLFGKLHSRAE